MSSQSTNRKAKHKLKDYDPNHSERRTSHWVWPALAGTLVGAAVVGAAWGVAGHGHPNDPLVASVGAYRIHQSDFVQQMQTLSGKQTLQQMIDNQLIKDGAKAHHISASKTDLNNAVKNLEAQYHITSSTQFQQFLQSNGLTQSSLDNILTVNILEKKLSELSITVTDKEIQDYYNKNKQTFIPKGKKTPEPLSAVRSQIKSQIMQSKATPQATLLADLAKKNKVTIYDSTYASIKTSLETPPQTAAAP